MGQLQQNVAGSHFYEEELGRQRRFVFPADEAVDIITLRMGCTEMVRKRLAAVLGSDEAPVQYPPKGRFK